PAQTRPDPLKPVLTGLSRFRPAQTRPDRLNPDQSGSNRF
ncbi:hypothetical protein CP09DC79_1205, partial [Chlamydia psittaci 09DC79]